MTSTSLVYLASQSPRRLQLLQQWGLGCELLLPTAGEDAEALEVVQPGEAPKHYVQRVTHLKLQAALARLAQRGLPVAPVLCADTTVALGRTILGKPASELKWGTKIEFDGVMELIGVADAIAAFERYFKDHSPHGTP